MFVFNSQERKVIVFLLLLILLGLGVDFAAKKFSCVKIFKSLDENMFRLDINQAQVEDFISTRCLSRSLAEKLVSYRQEHGPFSELEEVKRVKGIKSMRYEKIKKYFFVK